MIFGNTPFALSHIIKEEIPEVEDAIRMQHTVANIRYKDNVFNQMVTFVDKGFLDMFYFNLLSGSRNVLENKELIVLSKKMANKLFGFGTALGKQVSLQYSLNGKEYSENFFIGAVADDFDYMTSIRFQILIPFENRNKTELLDDVDWKNHTSATFVTLKNSDQAQHVTKQINAYIKIQNEANPGRKIARFLLDPLPKMALHASRKEAMVVKSYPHSARIILTLIGLFILILAVFNYMNISIVSATSRLKEIGLRKTIGGSRKQIIVQFLFENTLLCFLALVFGYILAIGFMLPGFNSIVGSYYHMTLDYGNPRLWIFIFTLYLVVSFSSAAYPAFFVSGFRPVSIFRGALKLSNKGYITKPLLAIQLIVSFITISLGVVFVLNNNYIENRDWGYNKEQTIIIPLVYNDQYHEMKNALVQNTDIKFISGTKNQIGYGIEKELVEYESEQYVSNMLMVDYEYLDVLGFRLKFGRFFENYSVADLTESVVVNETFVNKLNLNDPIGTRIIINNKAHYIIGVADDFHFKPFGHRIEPLFFKVTEETDLNFLAIRTAEGKAAVTEEFVHRTWRDLFPDNTYEGYFQNETFDLYYEKSRSISKIMITIAGLAILISCMGLFGLVSLFISKKMKEFSIRKVMGASKSEIGYQFSKAFIWVLLISSLIGGPFAFLLSTSVVESLYKYHVPINALPFIFTTIILILTALATISSQLFKAFKVNPAEQLRDQ